MKHGDYAWTAIAAGVLLYEITAPPGQLLSEAMDKYRQRHPAITTVSIVYVASHLLRLWPRKIDPLHVIATKTRRSDAA